MTATNDPLDRQLAVRIADTAGVTALLVHALSEQVRRLDLSRGFIESQIDPDPPRAPIALRRRTRG